MKSIIRLPYKYLLFSGKHLCVEKSYVKYQNDMPGQDDEVDNIELPGDLDEGSPLVIEENGRNTVIGMFLKQMKGPAVYAQITPATINWIRENADWIQESSCARNPDSEYYWAKENLFTSCGCGIPNRPARRRKRSASNRRKRRKPDRTGRNRILNGNDVPINKYPWQVMVINKLREAFKNYFDL